MPIGANSSRDIPLVLAFYLGYKFWKKTRLIPVQEIPLQQALQEVRDDAEDEPVRTSKWSKFNILWG